LQIVGRCLAFRRPLTHDDAADRRVPDEKAGVWCERSVDLAEVFTKGTPSSSAPSGMPSTRASIFIKYSPCSGSNGAIVKPQLPPITLVTPCNGEGERVWSQNTWAS
jgi:hypothetical protein